MTRNCSNCGVEISGEAKYCGNCGERLSSHDEESAPDTESELTIPRKSVLETLGQSSKWLLGFPILLAAFLLVELSAVASQVVSPTFSLVNLVVTIIVGGMAYVYVEFAIRGQPADVGAAVIRVLDQILPLLGVSVVYFVSVIIGSILLILPGIYLGARLILALPACVLDGQDMFESLSTGWNMSSGRVLKLVGIFLVGSIPAIGSLLVVGSTESHTVDPGAVLLLSAPVFAFINGIQQMAVGRVYFENR